MAQTLEAGGTSEDMLGAVLAVAGHELRSDVADLTIMMLQQSADVRLTQGISDPQSPRNYQTRAAAS